MFLRDGNLLGKRLREPVENFQTAQSSESPLKREFASAKEKGFLRLNAKNFAGAIQSTPADGASTVVENIQGAR